MNMDEFLNRIWTTEQKEDQVKSTNSTPTANDINATMTDNKGIAKKSMRSPTIPGPILARKTPEPEEQNTTQQRQLTFGEMTLEDFLVRAGVEFEQSQPSPMPIQPPPMPIQQRPYKMGTSNFVPCQPMPHPSIGAMSSTSGVGYGQVEPLARAASIVMSPVSPGNLCNQLGDGTNITYASGVGYGMDMGKGITDGPIERVVDRRRRRLIKNRESAARSRARKHAYVSKLEAELNQVKEENAHLKQVLAEMETKRRQQQMMEMKAKSVADFECCKELPLSHSDKSPCLKVI